MSSVLLLLLVFSPYYIFSYNIDTSYPIIYEDPESGGSGNNSFGFSVALSWRRNSTPASSLFVGAPQSSEGEGKVYRCINEGTNAPSCRSLIVDSRSALSTINIVGSGITLFTGKSKGLGASMSTGESASLTVCAPYTLINSTDRFNTDNSLILDMRGYCYDVPHALGDILYRDNDILRSERRYPNNNLINTMYGFSVHYAAIKGSDMVQRIIGQPRLNKVAIKKGRIRKYMPYELDEVSNLGYSVSSGYFFDKNQLVFAAGAPGWMRRGRVVILASPFTSEKYIEGSVLGEYFGASLATGDFDGDHLEDIAVGAPHSGEIDFGRVYTFYGKDDGTFKTGLMLQGTAEYGQFGYSLAAADLDQDGYSDLIVSAPWEGSGVIYIYYGSLDFRSEHSSVQIIQRIDPSAIMPQYHIERFGFSLSEPVDIDKNGYPDLAIGAYKSGHAVVLRSRPIIKTELRLFSYPAILQRSTKSFVISVCLKYRGKDVPDTQAFMFEMTVDEDHKRIEHGSLKILSDLFARDQSHCKNETVTFTRANSNIVDPIIVHVKHSVEERGVGEGFCSSCPVLSTQDSMTSVQMQVPFNTGCQDGIICKASLTVAASFSDTNINSMNEWVVGSGDIGLNLAVTNRGSEPAYESQLSIDIPAGIRLRNGIAACMEDKKGNAITLVCEMGNPLAPGEMKSFRVDFDMARIVELAGGTVLTFYITKWTRSIDEGTGLQTEELNLIIRNVAYITLTGLANEESHDYSRTENKSVVPIRHSYQVLKVGETPIMQARLTINVPIRIVGKNNSFSIINESKFTDSTGKMYKCSIDETGNVIEDDNPPESSASVPPRRRRDIPEYDDETSESIFSTGLPLAEYDNEQSNFTNEIADATVQSQTTERTIYLNCSTDNVSCAKITCMFSLSKTSDDMGNVALDIAFNANDFHISDVESLTIKFHTNASVEILLPFISDPTYIRNTSAGVTTLLYNIPEPQKLGRWIIPSSIVFGILLFFILAFILFRVGFFNRPKKAETAKAKEMDMILKTGGSEENELIE